MESQTLSGIGASTCSYAANGNYACTGTRGAAEPFFAGPAADAASPKQVIIQMRGAKYSKPVPNGGSLALTYKEVARVARIAIPKNTQVTMTVYLDLQEDDGMQKWLDGVIQGPGGAVGVDLQVRGGISFTAYTLDRVASFKIPPRLGEWMEAMASAFEGCTTNNKRTLKLNPYLQITSIAQGTTGFKLETGLIREIRKMLLAADREKLPPPMQVHKSCASGTFIDQLGRNIAEAMGGIGQRARAVSDRDVDAAYKNE